jgi:hypothetical protein
MSSWDILWSLSALAGLSVYLGLTLYIARKRDLLRRFQRVLENDN